MTFFVNFLSKFSLASQTIVSIAIILAVGFFATRITKKIKLPNVTGYILAGILIGPYCLNLIPQSVIGGLDFISDIALAFIAFGVGEFFKFDTLKKNGIKVVIITLFEATFSSILVFLVTYFVLGLNIIFAIVLSALASATAPASTLMTIRQTKAKGDFVNTLLQVIALDNIVSLIAYSIAISIAMVSISNNATSFSFALIAMPILKNLIVIVLGALFGYILKLLMTHKFSSDNRLIIVICVLFMFCAVTSILSVSPLLGCMMIGMIYINLSKDEKLFLQINYFIPPILLLFFVKSGLGFNFSSLFASKSLVSSLPLWVISLIYLLFRLIGKYFGAFVGGAVTKSEKNIKNYLGLALIPQASVAIALAAMGARILGAPIGESLQTVILASSVLYEIVGPICAKMSLYLSKSYSNKLEDIVNVPVVNTAGVKKSKVDLLIEQIHEIEKRNNMPLISEEEQAFNEASEEALIEEIYTNPNRNRNNKRKF